MKQFFDKTFCLEVWGDYACFTRPEMKVERVSYDVITPSAARAIFEAIFWKPAIRWQIKTIEVLQPIKWISVRRNEVGAVMSGRSDGLFIEENRQQRAGLFLKDVRYRLYADLVFIPLGKRNKTYNSIPEYLTDKEEQSEFECDSKNENPGKYNGMFERRARKGQCFNRPYLGCREFSSMFRLVDDPRQEAIQPINETKELGFMLYDMDFTDIEDIKPAFFKAKLENGVVTIPAWDSEEVKR
ncbi:MAG: type I-C CRISPR-associated protein Cas5 [Omnitrophica WOR_2 bacterium RIFCSPHIGHO2_01_FULL_48_9]|nr:MAG: type I-C CRISPR-associated protein Cas5 [Omnitrophica WOR_2 bacterium RIFCSPHIGHO2_02_FULL_48_11]OGX32207.1 MAG: type I-C CRISPR-associated protein Cas5 [Omnitrophica WOR_2 bacterium RIFCSPHIGHO2_01_FULL_48_9]